MINNGIGITTTGNVVEGDLLKIQGMDFMYVPKTKEVVKLKEFTAKIKTKKELDGVPLYVGDTIGNKEIQGQVSSFMNETYVNVYENDCLKKYTYDSFLELGDDIKIIEKVYGNIDG